MVGGGGGGGGAGGWPELAQLVKLTAGLKVRACEVNTPGKYKLDLYTAR